MTATQQDAGKKTAQRAAQRADRAIRSTTACAATLANSCKFYQIPEELAESAHHRCGSSPGRLSLAPRIF